MSLHGYSDGEYEFDVGEDNNVTKIRKLDVSHPLHLHPHDSVALTVVSVKLKRIENYQVWSCAMLPALEGKNKTGFIDGSYRRSNTDEVIRIQYDISRDGNRAEIIEDRIYHHRLRFSLPIPSPPTSATGNRFTSTSPSPSPMRWTLGGNGGESFWEGGDDFGVDVLRFHTCLTDILGFLEKFGWWFKQDIDGENEDDNENKLVMVNEEG
ncbi:ribonuclease H-like domain-containing protein [Tanacetum coccineum]